MIQVYCDAEDGINRWLAEQNGKIEVIDIKMSMNEIGEYIMVIYKTNKQEVPK